MAGIALRDLPGSIDQPHKARLLARGTSAPRRARADPRQAVLTTRCADRVRNRVLAGPGGRSRAARHLPQRWASGRCNARGSGSDDRVCVPHRADGCYGARTCRSEARSCSARNDSTWPMRVIAAPPSSSLICYDACFAPTIANQTPPSRMPSQRIPLGDPWISTPSARDSASSDP